MHSPRLGLPALAFLSVFATLPATPAHAGETSEAKSHDDAATLGPLVARAARHAAQFEEMKRRGSFMLSGRMEELDRKGKVDVTKEMVVRVTATPATRQTEILRYTENGADKTAEARTKADKSRAERDKKEAKEKKTNFNDLHLPFLASEQPRYVFTLAERDPALPTHVRVSFVPVAPAEDALKGSAWLDETTGEVLTMGFSPTKNPSFVDHVDVTMRFDLATPLGRAPSSVAFDVRGGFLIVKKHLRGSMTITDPSVAF
jgi:hypothetical protein